MKILLTTNVRDERHIVEWVTHHILIGFTHIFINDHLSVRPVHEVLEEAGVPSHRYTVRRINNQFVIKNVLMKEMYTYASRTGYDWTINLDGDEMLVLPQNQLVSDFLARYNGYDQVGVNWLMFGTSYYDEHPVGGGLVDTYLRCDAVFEKHIKSFVRVNLRVKAFNAHVYFLADMSRSVNVFRQSLNKKTPFWSPVEISFRDMPAFVAHYIYMSYEDFLRRKIALPRDDAPTHRNWVSREQLDKSYNNVENTEVRDRFADRIEYTRNVWKNYKNS